MDLRTLAVIGTPLLIILLSAILRKNRETRELRRQIAELQDMLDKAAVRDIANLDPAIVQQSTHPEVPATAPDIDPSAESPFDLSKYADKN
jgi:hypothetical protein